MKGHDKPSTARQESSPEAQFVGMVCLDNNIKIHRENDL